MLSWDKNCEGQRARPRTPGQGTGGREPRGQGGAVKPHLKSPRLKFVGPRSPHTSAKRNASKFQDGSSGALNQAQGPVAHKALREAGPDVTGDGMKPQETASSLSATSQSGQRAGHLPATQAAGPTVSRSLQAWALVCFKACLLALLGAGVHSNEEMPGPSLWSWHPRPRPGLRRQLENISKH